MMKVVVGFVVVLFSVVVCGDLLIPWVEEEELNHLEWIPQVNNSMSMARAELAAVAIKDRIFVLGGFQGNHSFSRVEVYDNGTWTPVPPMPTPRHACAAVAVNDHIFVIGGSAMEMLDTKKMVWTSLPPMSAPRFGASAVVVDNRYVLVLGGSGNPVVERFDTKTQTWTFLPPMATTRYFAAAAFVADRVYVLGGLGGETSIEVLDIRHETWTTLSLPMPFCRRHAAVVTMHDKIVLLGGHDGTHTLQTIDVFDTTTLTWTRPFPLLTTPRQNAAAVLTTQQHPSLVVVGGFSSHHGYLDTMERLVLDDAVTMPIPPALEQVPFVVGRRHRRHVLTAWLQRAQTTKRDYVMRVKACKNAIVSFGNRKRGALEEEMRQLWHKRQRLGEEEARHVAWLERRMHAWTNEMDDRIADANDQITRLQDDPPSHLLCPMTGQLMTDPVLAADGYTYERSAVENWLAMGNTRSLVTLEPMPHNNLTPNLSIKALLQQYQQEQQQTTIDII